METEGLDRDAAAAQLAALRADRVALADRLLQPWWYDVALGLLVFGLLSSYAFDSLWVTFPALVVFLAGLVGLMSAYKRITGLWVQAGGLAKGVWAALVLVVWIPALVLAEGYDQRWAAVVAGVVLGLAAGVMSRIWGLRCVAGMRAGL
jgi:hypothetical protein